MDLQKTQRERQVFAQRSVVLGWLVAASVVTNLILSVCLFNGSRIVLVPTLPGDAAVDPNGRVDADYLENLTRDAAWLFLNKTPETAGYFTSRAQRLMDPAHFEAVKTALERESAKAERSHSSQAFFPAEFFVDPVTLYSEARGRLMIMQGQQVIDDQDRVYAMHWTKTGTLVRLSSIEVIEPKNSKGQGVRPASEGEGQ